MNVQNHMNLEIRRVLTNPPIPVTIKNESFAPTAPRFVPAETRQDRPYENLSCLRDSV